MDFGGALGEFDCKQQKIVTIPLHRPAILLGNFPEWVAGRKINRRQQGSRLLVAGIVASALRARQRRQFCPELWTNIPGNRRNLIEVNAVFQAMRRGRNAQKIVQEAEQAEALFSGILIVAGLVLDAARSAGNVREFCVPDTPRHETDLL